MSLRQPALSIFYQHDPWHASIGGIQTIINNFIKYSPEDFSLRLVGASATANRKIGEWQTAEFQGKEIEFLPAISIDDDNVRSVVPTTLRYTAALLKLSPKIQADFMHFHRIEPSLVAGSWKSHKALFIHNDIHKQIYTKDDSNAILWRKFPGVYLWLERRLIQQFDQILSCNSESARLYREHYPEFTDKIEFIKNTVDDEVFQFDSIEQKQAERLALAQELGVADETQFLFFAGRLHPQKDPVLLVKSMAALQVPHTHLLIAGQGELEAQVRAEIERLGIENRVTLLGALNTSEMARIHRASSLFVLTSAYEGLPLVVLEALACGTPVVTTDCGETPKLLSPDSGIVCKERSPEAIAAALTQVLVNFDKYPAEACEKSAKPFSAESVIAQVYANMRDIWQQAS